MNKAQAAILAGTAASLYQQQVSRLESQHKQVDLILRPLYQAYWRSCQDVFTSSLLQDLQALSLFAQASGSSVLSELLTAGEAYESSLQTLYQTCLTQAESVCTLSAEALRQEIEPFQNQPQFENLYQHQVYQRPLALWLQVWRWLLKSLGQSSPEEKITQALNYPDFEACCERYTALSAQAKLNGILHFRQWQHELFQTVLQQSHPLLWLKPQAQAYQMGLESLSPVMKSFVNQQATSFKKQLREIYELLLQPIGFREHLLHKQLMAILQQPDGTVNRELPQLINSTHYFQRVWDYLKQHSSADNETLARFHALSHQVHYLNEISQYLNQLHQDRRERMQKMSRMAMLWAGKTRIKMPNKTKWLVDLPRDKAESLNKQLPMLDNLFKAIAAYSDYSAYTRLLASGHTFLPFDIFANQARSDIPYENFNRGILPEITVYRESRKQKKADYKEIAAWLSWRDTVGLEEVMVYEEEEFLLADDYLDTGYSDEAYFDEQNQQYVEDVYAADAYLNEENAAANGIENAAENLASEAEAAVVWEATEMADSVNDAVMSMMDAVEDVLDHSEDQS